MVLEKEQEAKVRTQFDQRSSRLWDDIEMSIRKAEDESRSKAEAETQRLKAMRLKQQEQEQIAQEARKREAARIEDEKRSKETEAVASRLRESEDEQRKIEQLQAAKDMKASENQKQSAFTTAREEYNRWKSLIDEIKKDILPAVASNATWRKQCFEAKRRVTPKVGQVTNSRQEIIRVTAAISEVLSAAHATGIKHIHFWILNHLSKCLIRQAEQEVAAKQSAAFPLAQVVSWLLLEGHTEFGNVLMARLVKKCCWCLPFLPQRTAGESDADYRKRFGHKDASETQNNFTSRMSGIFAFYCAILQARPTSPPSGKPLALHLVPDHFRLQAAWKWQARSLQAPIVDQNLIPTLWATLLEIDGPRFLAAYGVQGAKALDLLLEGGIRAKRAAWASHEDAAAATVRLTLILEEWQKTTKVKEAEGSQMLA